MEAGLSDFVFGLLALVGATHVEVSCLRHVVKAAKLLTVGPVEIVVGRLLVLLTLQLDILVLSRLRFTPSSSSHFVRNHRLRILAHSGAVFFFLDGRTIVTEQSCR